MVIITRVTGSRKTTTAAKAALMKMGPARAETRKRAAPGLSSSSPLTRRADSSHASWTSAIRDTLNRNACCPSAWPRHGWPSGNPCALNRSLARLTPSCNSFGSGCDTLPVAWSIGFAVSAAPCHAAKCATSGASAATVGAGRGTVRVSRPPRWLAWLTRAPISGILPSAEVMVGSAAKRFDADGNLMDEATKEFVRQLLQNLVNWTRRLSQSQ